MSASYYIYKKFIYIICYRFWYWDSGIGLDMRLWIEGSWCDDKFEKVFFMIDMWNGWADYTKNLYILFISKGDPLLIYI
jgi:hypothetical protein